MMATTRLMTAEDLAVIADDDQRYDLIRGELLCMAPAGAEHGEIALEFGSRIANHVVAHSLGKTYGAETGFLLARAPDTVLAPEVAFVRADRLPPRRSDRRGFLPLAPDLAVEIISPSDRAVDVARKVHTYLDAGVPLLILVSPAPCTVALHRPGRPVQTLHEGDELDLSEVLPGFRLPIADLFRE